MVRPELRYERRLATSLAASAAIIVATVGAPSIASAQGRCIRAYGTPACNTDPIKPVFERTGWRTTGLDHITFRVADPQREAGFYAAVMGWKVRSADGARVVMDIGDWGTAVFRKAPADSFGAPAAIPQQPVTFERAGIGCIRRRACRNFERALIETSWYTTWYA